MAGSEPLQEAAEAWLRWLAESHSRSHRAYSEFMKYQILPHLGAASIATGKVRHVPILDSALDVLRRRRLMRGASPLVFPGKGGRVRAQSPVTCAFKGALRRAQLDESLVWHALRHTGASWWVMSGGDIFRLSKLMGHADVKITQKTYAHLAPEAWHQDYHRLAFHVPTEPARGVRDRSRWPRQLGRAPVDHGRRAGDSGSWRSSVRMIALAFYVVVLELRGLDAYVLSIPRLCQRLQRE